MKPSEILYRAIEILDERGWCRRQYEDDKGRCCAMGAIRFIERRNDAFSAFTRPALQRSIGGTIVNFNDNEARDKRHVQQKMRKAAKALEAEGR